MTGPLLRHPGSNHPGAAPTGNKQFMGQEAAGLTGGPRRSCMGCGQFRPQAGGAGKSPRWRCAACVAQKRAGA